MSEVVQFSENQRVYSSPDGERYRVPIGDKYEVSIIKNPTALAVGSVKRQGICESDGGASA